MTKSDYQPKYKWRETWPGETGLDGKQLQDFQDGMERPRLAGYDWKSQGRSAGRGNGAATVRGCGNDWCRTKALSIAHATRRAWLRSITTGCWNTTD